MKSLPPDQLIDMIQNLAKHVSSQPATNVASRAAKTIVVGQQQAPAPTSAQPTSVTVATSSHASASLVAPGATVSATTAMSSAAVASDGDAPPRPSRPPPTIVKLEEEDDGSGGEETSNVAGGEDDHSSSGTPVRSRSHSFVDLTTVPDDGDEEPEFVIISTGNSSSPVHVPESIPEIAEESPELPRRLEETAKESKEVTEVRDEDECIVIESTVASDAPPKQPDAATEHQLADKDAVKESTEQGEAVKDQEPATVEAKEPAKEEVKVPEKEPIKEEKEEEVVTEAPPVVDVVEVADEAAEPGVVKEVSFVFSFIFFFFFWFFFVFGL